jgi:hypothetical protein
MVEMKRRNFLGYVTAAGAATVIAAGGGVVTVNEMMKIFQEEIKYLTNKPDRLRFIRAITPTVWTGNILYSPRGDSNQPSSMYSFAEIVVTNKFGGPTTVTRARQLGGQRINYLKPLDTSILNLEQRMYDFSVVEFRGTPERENEAEVRIMMEERIGPSPRIIRDSWFKPNELIFEEELPNDEPPKILPKEGPGSKV